VPSRSRSPSELMPRPKWSKESSGPARPPLVALILPAPTRVPSAARRRRWTAPALDAPSLSPRAPTARSGVPLPSRSPIPARALPNQSWSSSAAVRGPAVADSFCSARTVPLAFRNSTCAAPRSVPPSSSSGAPTARSPMPSPSRSPMPATSWPNSSRSSRAPVRPPAVSLIFCSARTVPSGFRNRM
jgi:hypothetical protein